MLQLLPLAFVSAIYPTLLAMIVVIMQRPNPQRMLAAYLAGAWLVSMTAGLVVIAAFNAGDSIGASDRTISPWVDVLAGLAALALLWVLWTDRDRGLRERRQHKKAVQADDGRDPWSTRLMSKESLRLTFLAAIVLNLPGAMYLVALKDMAASGDGNGQVLVQLVIYNLIMFTWAELPLLGYRFAPEATTAFIARANSWLGGHGRQIAMVLCGLAGAVLVLRGVLNAVS